MVRRNFFKAATVLFGSMLCYWPAPPIASAGDRWCPSIKWRIIRDGNFRNLILKNQSYIKFINCRFRGGVSINTCKYIAFLDCNVIPPQEGQVSDPRRFRLRTNSHNT